MTTQQEQGIKRELSLGEVLSKTFDLYRRDFAKFRSLRCGWRNHRGRHGAGAAGVRPPDSASQPDASAVLQLVLGVPWSLFPAFRFNPKRICIVLRHSSRELNQAGL